MILSDLFAIMSTLVLIIFIFCILCDLVAIKKLDQAGAVVKFCDPEYIIDCKAITRRRRRQEPYLTNLTATTLQPFYNNVTIVVSFNPEKYGDMFTLKIKMCDMIKVKWLEQYLRKYSNVPITCPVPAGSYNMFNMEFPPKNFPMPLPNEDMNLRLLMEVTETKHLISQCEIKLHS
ncbi:unnamed protein product [Arctia plantaginis]|uniref:Uncharacterized protein n=1 Tax=Arctia plantaginis TaxID=874455 RepID=A0A8S0ZS64_ARCPL|nr:unnamed protein product [Arctia plantaginis]